MSDSSKSNDGIQPPLLVRPRVARAMLGGRSNETLYSLLNSGQWNYSETDARD